MRNFATQVSRIKTAKLVEVDLNSLFSHVKTLEGNFKLKVEVHKFHSIIYFLVYFLNLCWASRSVICWDSVLLASSALSCHLMILQSYSQFLWSKWPTFFENFSKIRKNQIVKKDTIQIHCSYPRNFPQILLDQLDKVLDLHSFFTILFSYSVSVTRVERVAAANHGKRH